MLGRGHKLGTQGTIALTVAAFFTYLIANFTRVVTIRLGGQQTDTTLAGAVQMTWQDGEPIVAIAAAATAIIAPALLIGARLYLLLPLANGHVPRHFGRAMRLLHEVTRWNMVEVLMVAAVVSIVRIAQMAEATPGPGMFAFGALALLIAALEARGVRDLWLRPA